MSTTDPEQPKPSPEPSTQFPDSEAAELRIALILHGLLAVVIGFPLWLVTFEFSVMGSPSDNAVLGLAVFFIVVFGPSPLLGLLAAVNLRRRPRAARVYLWLAGFPAAAQLIVLGLYAFVIPFLLVPAALLGGATLLQFMAGRRMAAWLRHGTSSGSRWRPAAVDLGVRAGSGGTIALAAFLIWDLVLFPGQRGDHDFDESRAWEKLEASAADVVTVFPDFAEFRSRTLYVIRCGGSFRDGGEYYRYELTYQFTDAVQADPLARAEYRLAAREHWLELGHEIQFDGQNQNGTWAIVVHDDEGLRLAVHEGGGPDDPIRLNLQTGCVKREGEPPCVEPQGGVPLEADRIIGIRCDE